MLNRILFPIMFIVAIFFAMSVVVLFSGPGGQMQSAEDVEKRKDPSAFLTAIQLMWADMTGRVEVDPGIEVTGYLPAAPEGWARAPYKTPDGEEITETKIIYSKVVQSTTNSLLLGFESASKKSRLAEVLTYRKGDEVIAANLVVPKQFNKNTVRGGIMSMLKTNMAGLDSSSRKIEVFALHHGIRFTQSAQTSKHHASGNRIPVDYRLFKADVGGLININIMTNASDASVAQVMEGIDMGALIALLPEPEPHMLVSTAFETHSEDLSTEKPGPTIARQAYLLLNSSINYTKEERDFLDDAIDQRILGWSDIYEDYGSGKTIDEKIIALLGDRPQETPELERRISAKDYLLTNIAWSLEDEKVLGAIATGKITQWSDMYQRYGSAKHLAPQITQILGQRPKESLRLELQIKARDLLKSDHEWLDHEAHLLGRIDRNDEVTRTSLERALPNDKKTSEEVLALIRAVPLSEKERSDRQGSTGIRVGGGNFTSSQSCKIENGVRRCRLGE